MKKIPIPDKRKSQKDLLWNVIFEADCRKQNVHISSQRSSKYLGMSICDVLHDLVPFVRYKKWKIPMEEWYI